MFGPGITESELYLITNHGEVNEESTLVQHKYYDNSVLPVAMATSSIMFDSTVFPSGISLCVKFKVRDQFDQWYSDTFFVQVVNKAQLFGDHDLESSPIGNSHTITEIQNIVGARYNTNCVIYPHWAASDVEVAWSDNVGLAAFNNHTSQWVIDCYHINVSGSIQAPEKIFTDSVQSGGGPNNVLSWRQNQIGPIFSLFDLPPFNSTGKTPINIAYIDGCHSLEPAGHFFETMLYPYFSAYSPHTIENQCIIGFDQNSQTSVGGDIAKHLFELMNGGTPVQDAVDLTNIWILNDPSMSGTYSTAPLVMFGDIYTKLRGVYDPGSLPSIAPYRILEML